MSHYTEMQCNALSKNEAELVASLKAQFGEKAVEVHDEAKALTGYDQQAKKKAHIIVRKEYVAKVNHRKHAYNDIGYERREDGTYAMHYDKMDLEDRVRDRIMQDYAERVATRKLKAQGYSVKRTVDEKGKVVLLANPLGGR